MDNFEKSLDIAAEIIENGGEVFRAEEAVRRINGRENCSAFVIPSLIIAQTGNRISVRRILRRTINLSRLAKANYEARSLCGESSSRVAIPRYPAGYDYLAYFVSAGMLCLLFGGEKNDMLIAGGVSLIITCTEKRIDSIALFSRNLIKAFIISSLAYLSAETGISCQPDKIIIGSIMRLVPGIIAVNAARDIMNSDLVAGIIELAEAVASALGIALGVSGGLLIFGEKI
jgi:uncharacterized membrane protein YjjP (DUF1212 family)